MRKYIFLLIVSFFTVVLIDSCKKKETPMIGPSTELQADVIKSIAKMGFGTKGVITYGDGYIVEGDIFISKKSLSEINESTNIIIAKTEQYKTVNLVRALPRTLTVSVENLSSDYTTAAINAVNRFNNLNLLVKFQVVSVGGLIHITGFSEPYDNYTGKITLGISGFPSLAGDPYTSVKINTHPDAFGIPPNINYLTSIMQHELGHCIGLRHTDYFDRSYSCGGVYDAEPNTYDSANAQNSTGAGAINIPGTPTTADPNSFMLACTNGSARTFNDNDIIALNYLYGATPPPPTVNINGNSSYSYNQKGNASGTIIAPPGSFVYVELSGYGSSNVNSFTLNGAQLSAPIANVAHTYYSASQNLLTVTNDHTAATFTMPSSGSVNWYGSFSGPSNGTASIVVRN